MRRGALSKRPYRAALAWRPGHDEVLFTTLDRANAESLYAWDVAQESLARRVARAEGLIGGGRGEVPRRGLFGSGSQFAVCVTAAADTPPRLERVDLETGARRILHDPNRSLAEAVRASGPSACEWTDDHGQAFSGQYFPPTRQRSGPAPLFITYYGCPGYLRGGLGDEWPLASLAGAGVAALCIDEPAVDPAHLDQAARYDTALSGVRVIMDVLRSRGPGRSDPDRHGRAQLRQRSGAVAGDALRSARGRIDQFAFGHADLLPAAQSAGSAPVPRRPLRRRIWGLGAPDETPDRWRRLSPAFNVDKIHAALLMQMPEQEYLSALDYFAPPGPVGHAHRALCVPERVAPEGPAATPTRGL